MNSNGSIHCDFMTGIECLYWILMALAGFFLSVLAGKQCLFQKAFVHLYMMLTFIVFSTCCGYIAYLMGSGKSMQLLEPVWAFITIIVGLLLTPVFYKHFFVLAGDCGGICLEGGFLAMVMGFMSLTTHAYNVMPFIGMTSLVSFFLGYVRLQSLLFPRTSTVKRGLTGAWEQGRSPYDR